MATRARENILRHKKIMKRRKLKALYIKIVTVTVIMIIMLFTFILEKNFSRVPETISDSIELSENIIKEARKIEIVEKPEWIEINHIEVNEYSRPGKKLTEVNGIVIHYTGNPGTTAQQHQHYYGELAKTGERSASSNYVIGPDGKVIECVPEDEVAYASNDRNSDTISIECCHPDEIGKFTEETYNSLVNLSAYLCAKYDLKEEDILRHYDVTGKECPRYYVRNEEEWLKLKEKIIKEKEEIMK